MWNLRGASQEFSLCQKWLSRLLSRPHMKDAIAKRSAMGSEDCWTLWNKEGEALRPIIIQYVCICANKSIVFVFVYLTLHCSRAGEALRPIIIQASCQPTIYLSNWFVGECRSKRGGLILLQIHNVHLHEWAIMNICVFVYLCIYVFIFVYLTLQCSTLQIHDVHLREWAILHICDASALNVIG